MFYLFVEKVKELVFRHTVPDKLKVSGMLSLLVETVNQSLRPCQVNERFR